MDAVPIAFVDVLCVTLQKTDLEELQKIENLWSWTVETHYSRRRELTAYVSANYDEAEVGIIIGENADLLIAVPYTSLTKYDRIRRISIRRFHRELLPETIPMERFKTKVLPVLISMADAFKMNVSARSSKRLAESVFSVLRAPLLKIETGYTGQKGVEFIERQIALGRLEQLNLRGHEWSGSMKPFLKWFLKSPNFRKLDLRRTNLTVDLRMLVIIFERFLKGELCMETSLRGKPSDGKLKELREAVLSGDTLPVLYGLPQPASTSVEFDFDTCQVEWTGPGNKRLCAWFSKTELYIYQR
uniref:Uncharacterized protein n=1 Tax=Steinernema glaseri TaxID=37863 RepID=A0A1I8ARB1_9BILA